jgi:hypothetical protein
MGVDTAEAKGLSSFGYCFTKLVISEDTVVSMVMKHSVAMRGRPGFESFLPFDSLFG